MIFTFVAFLLFFLVFFFSYCLSCCCCLRFDLFEHPAQKFPALNYWSWRVSDLWPWIGLVTELRCREQEGGIGTAGMLVIWSSFQIDWLLAIYLPCWLWLCQNMCDMWNNEFVVVSAYCAFIYYINIVFKGFPINPNLWVDKVRFFLKLVQKAETERKLLYLCDLVIKSIGRTLNMVYYMPNYYTS